MVETTMDVSEWLRTRFRGGERGLAAGDGPVTFFRAVGPRQPSSAIPAGFEGIAFDRVVTARAALLR